MAQPRARSSRPISLLECLNDSLECGICAEENELRLLPCQHMICLQCLVEIQQTALKGSKIYSCPFCREDLIEAPNAYPVCRLAMEFKQQVQQLSSALKRRKSYQQMSISGGSLQSGTNKSSFKSSRGVYEETILEQPEDANNADEQDVNANNVSPASRPISFSNAGDRCQRCYGQNVTWICVVCHSFLCSSSRCRQGKCGTGADNSAVHQVKYVEDEVENSIEHFEDVKEKLRTKIVDMEVESKFLHLEVKTLAREVANSTESEMDTLRTSQKLRDKDETRRKHVEELQETKDMLSTLEEFVKEASDVEYVMVAQWIFENKNLDEEQEQTFSSSRYEVSLGGCELLTTIGYHHVSRYESIDQLIITKDGTFDMVNVSNGKISKSGRTFDKCKCLSVREYHEKLYCLCMAEKSKGSEMWVLDPSNPKHITKWSALMSDTAGFVLQENRAYIHNRKYISIHTLEGVALHAFPRKTVKDISDMTSLGNELLAICDVGRDEVVVMNSKGSNEWRATTKNPTAICSDWLSNLWVWSQKERTLTRISREHPVQVLNHPLFTELTPLDATTAIQVRNGFLWMTSPKNGLRRFAIKLTRNRTPEQNSGRRDVSKTLHHKLSRGGREVKP